MSSLSSIVPALARPLARTRLSLSLAAALVVAATLGAMVHFAVAARQETAADDRVARMRAIGQAVTSAVDQAGRFAQAQAETMARRDDVAAALAAGDRGRLAALSVAPWTYLQDQAGVTVFGYHSADLRYLLRVHKPESHGDDISRARPMVLAANKSGRGQVGVEIGVTGIVGVRGIAVVRDGGTFAGTMEVGLDLQPILDQIKTVTNADLAVVLSRSLAGLTGAADAPDLVVSSTTDQARFAAQMRAGRLAIAREAEVADAGIDGVAGALLRQPLVDYSGRLVGNVVALATFPDQAAEERRLRTDLTVVAVVGGILAFVLFSVVAFGVVATSGRDGEAA